MNKRIKNIFFTFLSSVVTILIGFITQKVFINTLGTEYLGVNGVLTNIISMLCLVEIGFGPAIIYNLYKPNAKNDYDTVKALLNFYKKIYRKIAFIIFIISLIIMPMLPHFISDLTIDINLNIIYILFIIDTVCTYLLSYKRSILYVNEENYIINIVHIITLIILNVGQILLLIYTKNYYLYLIIKIIMHLIENIIIVIISNKKYPHLKGDNVLDENIKQDIYKKVKALIVHKLAGFVVTGTDNIIISKFLGVIKVGLYANYYLIISSLHLLFGQALLALTPSVGNMLIQKNENKNFDTFKKIRFLNFWIACFSSAGLLIVMKPFITMWLGKEYLLDTSILVILIINYYHQMMKNSYMAFKDAAGIYYEDRIVPIIESILNIVFSLILVKFLGLLGVFIGTYISSLIVWLYSFPKYVYKKLFNRNYINYFKETLGYLILLVIILLISYIISSNSLIINLIITITVPNIIMYIIFYNNESLKYYKKTIKNIFSRGGNL